MSRESILLSDQQVADELGICLKTLRRHVAAGHIRRVVLGFGSIQPHYAFLRRDVDEFLERQRSPHYSSFVQPTMSVGVRTQKRSPSSRSGVSGASEER